MHIFVYLHRQRQMGSFFTEFCRILSINLLLTKNLIQSYEKLKKLVFSSSKDMKYYCQQFILQIIRYFIIFEIMNQTSPQQTNRPIPLIQFQGQNFKITQQATEFLRNMQGPIGIITIVGKYRTGKSLFLNKVLLNNNNSFKVCPTINSCTKGLWISRQVIKSQYPQSPDMDVIVIDTEGFGAMQQTDAYNNRILLFALLLSSYFIYNSVGSIDEKSLNNLNIITNLAKQLQSKNLSNDKIQEQFPTFMWIVRDFTLKLVDSNGCQMQPKQYLQYALEIQKGISDAVQNKNKIRRMIKHFFKQRDCYTLVTPVENETDLQKLNTLPDSSLRPQFVEQIQVLRQKILRRVKPKKIKNRRLTGQTFIQLANSYIQAINNGTLPNIQSAWKSINNYELSQTLSKTKQLVTKRTIQFMDDHINKQIRTQENFMQLQKELLNQSLSFMKKKISDQADLQSNYNIIKNVICQNVANAKNKNKKKSLQILLTDFESRVQQFGYQESSGLEMEYKWRDLENYYKKQFSNNPCLQQFIYEHLYPLKFEAFTSFLRHQSQLVKQLQQKNNQLNQTIQQSTKYSQTTIKSMKQNLYESQRQLTFVKAKYEQEVKIKLLQLSYTQKQLNQIKADYDKYYNKSQILQSQLRDRQKQLGQLRGRVSGVTGQLKQVEDDRAYLKKQIQLIKNNLQKKVKQIQQFKQINREQKLQIHKLEQRQNSISTHTRTQLQNRNSQYQILLQKYQALQKQSKVNNQKLIKLQLTLQSQTSRTSKQEKLYESMLQTLKQNYQNQRYHSIQLTQANKNMAFALKHLQQRFQQAEQKQRKLKQYKRCVKNSSCMQCQNCTKFFVPTIFPQHLNVCIIGVQNFNMKKGQNDKNKLPSSQIEIFVKQTLLKDSDSKPYTQYVLQIKKGSKNWTVNRKYKQFCNLHGQLKALLPGVNLSDCSYIVNPQEGSKKSLLVQQRRRILQKYLRDLAENPHIANQQTWKQFIDDQQTQTLPITNSLNAFRASYIGQNQGQIPSSSYPKITISQMLRTSHNNVNIGNEQNSPEKQNLFDANLHSNTNMGISSARQNHKTPQEFLRIWNQRNLRAKQVSKNKKFKN